VLFDDCGLRWRHLNGNLPLAELKVSEVQGNCSIEILVFLAEGIGKPCESLCFLSYTRSWCLFVNRTTEGNQPTTRTV
jgi:hypothetical protein